MATAQVQQVVAAPVHDNTNCVKEEEKNHEIIKGLPCAEVEEQASHAKVRENGGCTGEEGKKELEVPALDTDEGQRIAQEVEAKLSVQQSPTEAELKEPKLSRRAKKTEKAATKGAVVPVDDVTDDELAAQEGVKKKAEKAAAKWAVVPVDDETNDDEVVAPAVDEIPVAAPVAPEEEAEAGGDDATKGGKEDAREEKAPEE